MVWRAAFTTIVGELAPGEVFEIKATEDPDGSASFEMVTESPRVIVAWAEVQDAVARMRTEAKNLNEINDLASQ